MYTVTIISVLAGIISVASAQGKQQGNSITKPLNENIQCGQAFQIQWTPSTAGPVRLEFLKGPAENIILQNVIAQGLQNSGSFSWSVPAGVENSQVEAKGYGIRIVDEVTGDFQYSTQFGIKCDSSKPGTTTSQDTSSSPPTTYSTSSSTATETYAPPTNQTTAYPTETSTLSTATSYPTGGSGSGNSTQTYAPPTPNKPTSTEAPVAPSGGAASSAVAAQAAFGLLMGALAFAVTF